MGSSLVQVVMVENVLRPASRAGVGELSIAQKIRTAAHEVRGPVFFARLIIVVS
jgi:Cu/Ag efflux pump CusA